MSNAVLDAIFSRRSIRGYKPDAITEDQLQTLLSAGQAAPSANNKQPWHFTAVSNKALLARVSEGVRREMLKIAPPEKLPTYEDPNYSVFYHAPTVIFCSCPPLDLMKYAQTDTGMAIENMALAAYAMGLGSVILGMPRLAFTEAEAPDLRKALGFPDGYDFCLALAVGVPATTKEAHPLEPDRVRIIR